MRRMAEFRYPELAEDEPIFIYSCDAALLSGKPIGAQLCKYPVEYLHDIHEQIASTASAEPKTSFDPGDKAYVTFDGFFSRAEILEVRDADCLLDLVDFGTMELFPKQEIYPLDQELCTFRERIGIQILLKNDIEVTSYASAHFSGIEPIELSGRRYFHGRLSDFSGLSERSKVFQVQRYVPEKSASAMQESSTLIVEGQAKPVMEGGPMSASEHGADSAADSRAVSVLANGPKPDAGEMPAPGNGPKSDSGERPAPENGTRQAPISGDEALRLPVSRPELVPEKAPEPRENLALAQDGATTLVTESELAAADAIEGSKSLDTQSPPDTIGNCGGGKKAPRAARIPQPDLNDIEKVVVSDVPEHSPLRAVQLSRFDVLALENELDAFYGDASNRKKASDVQAGQFVIAPFGSQYCRAFVMSIDGREASLVYTDYCSEIKVGVDELIELTPGRFTEHPWAAVTCSIDEPVEIEEELTLKIESSYQDEFGLPIYTVRKYVADAAGDGDRSCKNDKMKATYPPLEFNDKEQTLYTSALQGMYAGFQLGQYTVEEMNSLNEKLTENLKENAPIEPVDVFAVGDLVGIDLGDGFYRGVVSKLDGGRVEVYQVDFGLVDTVEKNKIRHLPSEFIHFPSIGMRCSLRESQVSALPKESFIARNIKKKTHTDCYDVYEFDLTSEAEETSNNHSNDQVATLNTSPNESAVGGTKAIQSQSGTSDGISGNGNRAESYRDPEQPATRIQHKFEKEDFNHNISTKPEALEPATRASTRIARELDIGEMPTGKVFEIVLGCDPVQEALESCSARSPVGASSADFEPGIKEPVKLSAQMAYHPLKGPDPDHAALYGALSSGGKPRRPLTVPYETASAVGYPEFTSVPEKVFVSEKTDLGMMVQLSRFDLNHFHLIEQEMKAFLDSYPNLEPAPLGVGDLVILNRDDYRRRAEILEEVGGQFLVACIDYGCTFVVPGNQLVPLPKTLERFVRAACTLDGIFPYSQGQEIDLILYTENGKIRGKTVPSVSPQKNMSDRDQNESLRSSPISMSSEKIIDFDLNDVRDLEDPCADRSFDVVVTSVHRATKVCVVKSRSLALSKSVGETLRNQAPDLRPVASANLRLGSAVVARLETEPPRFRRAKVMHYNRAVKLFKLFLVDSGIKVKLPLSSLFELPAELDLGEIPGYAKILKLRADDLAFDARIVSEIFAGTLRCTLSYSHPDDVIPGEFCYEATLRNKSGNVIKQLNMKGVVTVPTDRFLRNPIVIPCSAESEYMDAIVVAAERTDSSKYSVTLLLVDLKERLDRVLVDRDQLKNLYAVRRGAPALAFLDKDPSPWKRARIVGRPLPGKYKLLLVDAGIEILSPVLKTYKCPANLLHIPEAAVEVSIRSDRQLNLNALKDRLVVVKRHWSIDYSEGAPMVELYDHEGHILLP
ncbi:uncharacterized protein LOC100899626 [Galendromus occidentalis]|uniref:Uncharacterized protein LOC100899626 n=1 Tax=Galendromus occidentalis TaxID=34638 RepID=A0AAJ6W0D3_9ACAR|nr:uncharacterized protein LOC100899626 [Galendromus occidentalis]